MAITVLEGTWEEVVKRATRFAGRRVRVTVEETPPSASDNDNRRPAGPGPEERIRLLNRVLAMNERVPPVSGHAFDREHIYAEDA